MTYNLPKIVFNEEVCASTYLQIEMLFNVWKKHLEKQSLNIASDANKEKRKTLLENDV